MNNEGCSRSLTGLLLNLFLKIIGLNFINFKIIKNLYSY